MKYLRHVSCANSNIIEKLTCKFRKNQTLFQENDEYCNKFQEYTLCNQYKFLAVFCIDINLVPSIVLLCQNNDEQTEYFAVCYTEPKMGFLFEELNNFSRDFFCVTSFDDAINTFCKYMKKLIYDKFRHEMKS